MAAGDFYNLCKKLDNETTIKLFIFMKHFDYTNSVNDIICDTYDIACMNNNINVIKNIINCVYTNNINLDIYWLYINSNKFGLYYLTKKYSTNPQIMYDIFNGESEHVLKNIQDNSIISYGFYNVQSETVRKTINRIML